MSALLSDLVILGTACGSIALLLVAPVEGEVRI
jgi:hypothetical protein